MRVCPTSKPLLKTRSLAHHWSNKRQYDQGLTSAKESSCAHIDHSALRVLFVIFLLCLAQTRPRRTRMQVQQSDDRLRTVLLKHWLAVFLPTLPLLMPFQSTSTSLQSECGFSSHTHTILVIPAPRQRWHPSAPSVPITAGCTKHLEAGALDPFKLYRVQIRVPLPFASTSH